MWYLPGLPVRATVAAACCAGPAHFKYIWHYVVVKNNNDDQIYTENTIIHNAHTYILIYYYMTILLQ